MFSNGKIALTILNSGATLADLVLKEDATRFSPLWNPARAARLAGGTADASGVMGHFLCLDGFGSPSKAELKAGYPFHGEAGSQHFEILQSTKVGSIASVILAARLPLAHEFVTRTIRMADGENIAYIDTEVENLLSFDRPISWAEHATIGPPFFEPGKVAVDIPAHRCRVRPEKETPFPGRLEPLRDFEWPMAPLRNGGDANLLDVPGGKAGFDLAACLVNPERTYGYIAAFRRDKKLLFGYVFRRRDFPWLMNWMNYSGDSQAARGIEFSTQPYDVSHRETVDAHEMFGMPTYRWLSAKSKLRTRFLLFYTKTPDDFDAVSDILLEDGQLKIRSKSGQTIVLNARLSL